MLGGRARAKRHEAKTAQSGHCDTCSAVLRAPTPSSLHCSPLPNHGLDLPDSVNPSPRRSQKRPRMCDGIPVHHSMHACTQPPLAQQKWTPSVLPSSQRPYGAAHMSFLHNLHLPT